MPAQELLQKQPYSLDGQIGYLLRLAYQRHSVIFQHHTLMDLTPTQFAALVRIHEEKSCSQNLLGRKISVDVATIKGVVDRLNKKGLIALSPDPQDRRRTLISLKLKAKEMMDELYSAGELISDETLRLLTVPERDRLLQLLAKIS